MLQREIGENKKITRMQTNIDNILALQDNLKAYLFNHDMQQDYLPLRTSIQEAIDAIEKNYPHIEYIIKIPNDIKIKTNPKAFRRIIDNLLSNASKYNKIGGKVIVEYSNNKLIISDTGKGIKDTKKVFNRFYKEQDRGIGVGLHIVKKLCNELKIKIELQSEVGVGSKFILTLND
jgi:signal transduction histidine kinase